MQWQEIRQHYPHQWLLLEAIAAHSSGGQRIVEDLAVLETFADGMSAMNGYRELHRRAPQRELYVLHTDREAVEITELHWLGIRAAS
jgi:O-methyltransferase involved in polyketide biosynthesis